MNKRLLIIGVIVLAIIVVAVILFSGQRRSGGPAAVPTLAEPAPTGIFTQPPNVAFSFASPPAIPATMPVYTFQPMQYGTFDQMAAKAAPGLNLGATPSAITRGGSTTKMWSRASEAALALTQTNGSFNLIYRQAKSAEAAGALSPDVAVQQFMLTLVPLTPNLSVSAAGTENGPFDGMLILDTPPPASYKNYFYSYTLESYPVATADLSLVPISVVADSGGIIRFANIFPPPTSITRAGTVTLLSESDILTSLAARRGVLLDTHNPQTPDQGVVPAFTKFVVENTKIIYAPKENRLLPALYMEGTGTGPAGAVQKATIFLWLSPEGSGAQL